MYFQPKRNRSLEFDQREQQNHQPYFAEQLLSLWNWFIQRQF